MIKQNIEEYLNKSSGDLISFWADASNPNFSKSQMIRHADYIYIRYLLGDNDWFCLESVQLFKQAVMLLNKFGENKETDTALPHLTAYLLGAINILESYGANIRDEILADYRVELDAFIDSSSYLPLWPKLWSHHTWRVSHWLGGIPSILLNLSLHDPKKRIDVSLVHKVLESCDKFVISNDTGLLVAYKSKLIQSVFRSLYKLRHNPEHGDIGGLVHIHWINHVLDRKYIKCENVLNISISHFDKAGFMEEQPYCLDFDYVQLIRTANLQLDGKYSNKINKRFTSYIADIESFFNDIPVDNYTLHKLPGALASLHEAHIAISSPTVSGLDCKPIDIIKSAYWL